MRTVRHAVLSGLASAVFAWSAAPAQTLHSSLAGDWSDTQNPNGVWSLNYNDTVITGMWTWQGGGPAQGSPYWGTNIAADGSFWKSQFDNTDASDWRIGDVLIHALSIPYGGASMFTNVTWTSPADGTMTISGRAWAAAMLSDRDVGWTLALNGQAVAGRSGVYGLMRTDAAAQFADNLLPGQGLDDIAVREGDVLRFTAYTDTYYGYFMGVSLDVEVTPCVVISTQPASASVCAGGDAAFSIAATGGGTLSYQWQWREIGESAFRDVVVGENSAGGGVPPRFRTDTVDQAAIEVREMTTGLDVEYRCIATDDCGSTISNAARLSINSADFNGDGNVGTDADIADFFACLGGLCCATCGTADFNGDGNLGTDADIESFFRVLGGGSC